MGHDHASRDTGLIRAELGSVTAVAALIGARGPLDALRADADEVRCPSAAVGPHPVLAAALDRFTLAWRVSGHVTAGEIERLAEHVDDAAAAYTVLGRAQAQALSEVARLLETGA
jgi:hypothetical protein